MSDVKDDAPAYVSKHSDERAGEARDAAASVIGHTETINRPRQEIYAFWKDVANLSRVMTNVTEAVDLGGGRTRWKIDGPNGAYQWESVTTEDVPGEVIAWESEPGADVQNSGRIEFRDAPPGRGTWVRAVIAYKPPMGIIGKVVAKVTQKEPSIQARRDLRRLKQLLETGEISTSTPPNREPKA